MRVRLCPPRTKIRGRRSPRRTVSAADFCPQPGGLFRVRVRLRVSAGARITVRVRVRVRVRVWVRVKVRVRVWV